MFIHMWKAKEPWCNLKQVHKSNVQRKHLFSLELHTAKSLDPCTLSDICFLSNSSHCVHRQISLKTKMKFKMELYREAAICPSSPKQTRATKSAAPRLTKCPLFH